MKSTKKKDDEVNYINVWLTENEKWTLQNTHSEIRQQHIMYSFNLVIWVEHGQPT